MKKCTMNIKFAVHLFFFVHIGDVHLYDNMG